MNSQVANARFQAAAAIRDAAIREWVFLTADEKTSLISFCLGFVRSHGDYGCLLCNDFSKKGTIKRRKLPITRQLLGQVEPWRYNRCSCINQRHLNGNYWC
ncbi:unnamed protein product [Camellia sinensis]